MKLFFYIERINALHKLIASERTGTPSQLAKRMHICESRLYSIIDELKIMGLPIEYCRKKGTYFYTAPYKFELSCNIRPLSEEEKRSIEGGGFGFPPFFMEWIRLNSYA